ncbi:MULTISPECIES: TetR/AcrR family transcriptional regulator [unclassified Streptomyces]|uniref:TetR/AcrR family transcriptional regulator n=1 Tax=unclassified Streptomyces TaxID=2593676 RepID=UPI00225BB722|nr:MULTISPECIES: TetR/AcrR family transcriptional regulator [unclassified Streptomyces]MCX4548214.1 TetR family transcriptional regulator [Streptomyces sp. NBC_01500]WSC19874.1 TetR family transcriptional regulator [Streptomyces sp. NBC_01766]WSV53893.1 TetR family transcriptional regulator [Streptomyces sp. NBC_01014]
MATRTRRTERREEPLSRERIVEAAIELLDTAGEGGLTFRALAERLATGPGAIYWHVTGKTELLNAATDAAITGTATADTADATPQEAIRALALGVFDAIDAHPWIGTQLAGAPSQAPMLRVFEHLGRQVQALGVPHTAQFTAASALLSYILGVGGQNAANARGCPPDTNRTEFLNTVSAAWADLDPDEYAFTRNVADQLRDHDDRAEFLAGIDLILTGIISHQRPTGPAPS